MSKDKPKEIVRHIAIDPAPKGKLKSIGGADHDDWNDRLAASTAGALPVDQRDESAATKAVTAVYSGMIDLKPADPVEGILISQLMAANQASLSMYRRAWAQPAEYLEARLRYLALADKASRTVSMLTEKTRSSSGAGTATKCRKARDRQRRPGGGHRPSCCGRSFDGRTVFTGAFDG